MPFLEPGRRTASLLWRNGADVDISFTARMRAGELISSQPVSVLARGEALSSHAFDLVSGSYPISVEGLGDSQVFFLAQSETVTIKSPVSGLLPWTVTFVNTPPHPMGGWWVGIQVAFSRDGSLYGGYGLEGGDASPQVPFQWKPPFDGKTGTSRCYWQTGYLSALLLGYYKDRYGNTITYNGGAISQRFTARPGAAYTWDLTSRQVSEAGVAAGVLDTTVWMNLINIPATWQSIYAQYILTWIGTWPVGSGDTVGRPLNWPEDIIPVFQSIPIRYNIGAWAFGTGGSAWLTGSPFLGLVLYAPGTYQGLQFYFRPEPDIAHPGQMFWLDLVTGEVYLA